VDSQVHQERQTSFARTPFVRASTRSGNQPNRSKGVGVANYRSNESPRIKPQQPDTCPIPIDVAKRTTSQGDERSGSPSRRDDLSTVKNAPFGDFGASVCSAWGSVVVCSIPARLEPPGFCPTKPLSIIAPREAQLKPSVKRIRACLHAQMKHVFKRNRASSRATEHNVKRNWA
jgi:hypothetical protein